MTYKGPYTRFPSSPLEIRVPFFLLFGFTKGTQKEKGQKGPTGKPSIWLHLLQGGLHSIGGGLYSPFVWMLGQLHNPPPEHIGQR